MTTLFGVYGDEVTRQLLDAWWAIFQPCDLDDVRAGMLAHVTDDKAGMFRPTPAHVIERMRGMHKQLEAQLSILRVQRGEELRRIDMRVYEEEANYRHGVIDRETAAQRIAGLRQQYRQVQDKPEYAILTRYQPKALPNASNLDPARA